jgi:hypothetical protein
MVNEWTNERKLPEYPEHYTYGNGISHIDHDDFNSTVLADHRVVKRFKGESAWSDAQRHARDLASARQREQW